MGFDTAYVAFLLTLGTVFGIQAGLFGVGGGLLLIPALLYLPPLLQLPLAISTKTATGFAATQSLAGGFSSAVGHYRQGTMNVRLVCLIGGVAMAGGWLGGALSAVTPDRWLQWALVLSLLVTIGVALKRRDSDTTRAEGAESDTLKQARRPVFLFWSFAAGVLAGLLGIGGSIFLVPMMFGPMRIPIRQAVACGAGTVVLIAIAAFFAKLQAGIIPLPDVLYLVSGALVGGFVGARLSVLISIRMLKRLYVAMLAVACGRVLIDCLAGSG